MVKHRKGCISQCFLSVNFTATTLTIYYLLQLNTTEQYHQRHDKLCQHNNRHKKNTKQQEMTRVNSMLLCPSSIMQFVNLLFFNINCQHMQQGQPPLPEVL